MSEESFNISLTDGLVRRIRQLQTAENRPGMMLRVSVLGGGCSGFQYEFSYVDALEPGDAAFEKDGIRLAIDDVSLEYLKGATIDYIDELIGAHFEIRNPNAKSSCGCGTSFSV